MTDDAAEPRNNGAVTTISRIVKAVMLSAAEAELCTLFINCREAVPARTTLEEMGHKQPPTPMQTDNTTALGVVNNNIVSKKLKSMYMRINWLCCREDQKQFRHYWKPGPTNLGEYSTKHHTAIHHRTVIPTYLTTKNQLDLIRLNNQAMAAAAALRTKNNLCHAKCVLNLYLPAAGKKNLGTSNGNSAARV